MNDVCCFLLCFLCFLCVLQEEEIEQESKNQNLEGEEYARVLQQKGIEPYTYFSFGDSQSRRVHKYLEKSPQWVLPKWTKDKVNKGLLHLTFEQFFKHPKAHLLKQVHFLHVLRSGGIRVTDVMDFLEEGQLISWLPNRFTFDSKKIKLLNLDPIDDSLLSAHVPQSFVIPSSQPVVISESDESHYWILKMSTASRGDSIEVRKSFKDLVKIWQEKYEGKPAVIQKYIQNPLLMQKKKFHIRNKVWVIQLYPLILASLASVVSIASDEFVLDESDMDTKTVHLTNFAINRQNTIWFDELNKMEEYQGFFSHQGTYERKTNQIQTITWKSFHQCFTNYTNIHFANQSGMTDVLGYDFMVDSDYNVYLLEVNSIPSTPFQESFTETFLKIKMEAHKLSMAKTPINDTKWHDFQKKYGFMEAPKKKLQIIVNEALDPPFYFTEHNIPYHLLFTPLSTPSSKDEL